jgi:hypothetical protein
MMLPAGTLRAPQDVVASLEAAPRVPAGQAERFSGYGVLGIAFASGNILALRRMPASSVGPAFTTVWHRSVTGRWTFHVDGEPDLSCGRYFGAAGRVVREDDIALRWYGPSSFAVRVPSVGLAWVVHLAPTRGARALAAVRRGLPAPIRRQQSVQRAMAAATNRLLGVPRVTAVGRTPSGHRFELEAHDVWAVAASTARRHGQHLGPPVSLRNDVGLGDFTIPRWGLFTVGDAYFEPNGVLP